MVYSCPKCNRKLTENEITGGVCRGCHKLFDRAVAENGKGNNPPAWLPYSQSEENKVENDSKGNSNKLAQAHGRVSPRNGVTIYCPNCGYRGTAYPYSIWKDFGWFLIILLLIPVIGWIVFIIKIFQPSLMCPSCGYKYVAR